MKGITERVEETRRRIARAAEASGRDPAGVRLVAISKGFDAAAIRAVVEAGLTDVGESRVQEAGRKHAELEEIAVNWHLVGHLQGNKARAAAAIFDCIHSIDSEEIARHLARERDPDLDPIAGLVEVELTGIPTRSGAAEAEVEGLVRDCGALPGVHLLGLMTIAPPGDPEAARHVFRALRELRDRVEAETGWPLPELSMGMSDDFEIAVEEGATMVGIGRALFGERPAG